MPSVPRTWWTWLALVFRRRPQTSWLDLAQGESDDGYNKKALRAIIERRRRNDWVRQRELEQLRQARHRGLHHGETPPEAHVSIFQSSQSSALDEREITLRKIDDIEAQMSRQWWGKPPPASVSPPPPTHDPLALDSEFASTQRAGPVTDAELALSGVGRVVPRPAGEGGGARASDLDPDLAEAALRWAAGDGAQAEAILLRALRGAAAQGPRILYLTALLDLYRATQQRDGFERALVEFADETKQVPPLWHAAAKDHEPQGPPALEGELTGDLAALLRRMTTECEGAGPIVLSCGRLQRMDFAAAGALLNWLQEQHCALELRDVNPLVATFLEIIGVAERARLMARCV